MSAGATRPAGHNYEALAAAWRIRTRGIREELNARRRGRVVKHGAVLGRDGTFAECKARNLAILRGAK